jgi:streptomycin 6-kinase
MVPDVVRAKALLRPGGERWLRELPDLVDELAALWDLRVGSPFQGGTESYVVEATTAEGVEAVVKIELPGDPSFAARMRVLTAANGRGYARLLRHDEERRALLLERLGESLSNSALPVRRQIEILCGLLRQAWDVPSDGALDTSADKALRLGEFIEATWEELGRPCSEAVVEKALGFAESRGLAFERDTAVVLHGDAHAHNALWAEDGYRFVDPESFLGEREYDLGISMREWSDELLAGDALALGRARCALLAELGGAGEQAVWEWGFLERVSTGLFCLQFGADRVGTPILAVAEHWV